ncbi:MAG: hypothetical protein IJ456_03470, partial [Bacteroides sp.]|nr:hypothetical protein [Bacteroides sp.]
NRAKTFKNRKFLPGYSPILKKKVLSLHLSTSQPAVQIDLVIDHADGIVTISPVPITMDELFG